MLEANAFISLEMTASGAAKEAFSGGKRMLLVSSTAVEISFSSNSTITSAAACNILTATAHRSSPQCKIRVICGEFDIDQRYASF